MAPGPAKQTTLLGFFSKAPKPATAPSAAAEGPPPPAVATPPPTTSKRRHDTPAAAQPSSSPTPAPRTDRPAKVARTNTKPSPSSSSMTPPPSSNPDVSRQDSPNAAATSSPAASHMSSPVAGRRRAARRVNYAEPKAQSDDEDDEDDEDESGSDQDRDEFVLSDASESESSEDEGSVVESEEPSEASEPDDDVIEDVKPVRRRASPRPPSPARVATPSPATQSISIPRSRTHLTKAERRVEDEKRKRMENEQAYSFLLDVRDKDMNRPGDLNYDKRTLYIPPTAWKTFTPFEKQFWEIKQNHWDTVLFFQKGKFYELYEEDALIGHRECDLKLTDRVKMKMVGVPEASFDMFATKLLALGYKVGRVDQCETAVAKGMRVGEKSRGGGSEIVRRELRHVVTSGTIVDGHVLADDLNSYCVSVKEETTSHGTSRFGVCTLDAATAEFRYMTFEDDAILTQLETLLRSLRIKEILLEKGCLATTTLRLIKNTISSTCQLTLLKPGTEFLDEDDTRARLHTLLGTIPDNLAQLVDAGGPALCALGGLLWYLEQLHLDKDLCASQNFAERAAPAQSSSTLILDAKSLMHLHVLQNDEGTDEGTLLRLLNRCTTPFGRRLFKLWLSAPLCDVDAIQQRLDAVDYAMEHPELPEIFERFAKTLPDLERMQSRIAAGKCRPRDFLLVLRAFERFQGAKDELQALLASTSCVSTLLEQLMDTWPPVAELASSLRGHFVTSDDGSFIPVQGESETFDTAVEGVHAAEARLEKELEACTKELGLSRREVNWKHIGTNEIYQLEVPARTKVPANWIVMSQTKAAKRYYTPRTKDLIRELKEARERRLAALKRFQDYVYARFRDDVPLYTRAIRTVAHIDALLSLAKSSMALGAPACRPEMIEHTTAFFEFTQLRHPCMGPSVLTGATEFIPNDVALGRDAEDVMVLTGGNMAGKSTTARTAATALILAQVGCYVPAAAARISPIDRIASRMGANDQLFRNQSTFMVEMLEASKILREATPRSLMIMDELGRGTSTFDGQAIAYAVLHELAAKTPGLCFFMTHYTTMAESLEGYPRLANRHMEVRVDDEQRHVVFTYRLVPGIAASSYGTQVAHIAGVPEAICTKAAEVSQAFWNEAQHMHAQRSHGPLPLATLADFARLIAIGRGQATVSAAGLAVLAHALQRP